MKTKLKLSAIAISLFFSHIAVGQMTFTNGTGCLIKPDNTITYAKPVTIYTFISDPAVPDHNHLKFSGVTVEPGQSKIPVPTSILQSITPGTLGAVFGTDPHDGSGHLTVYAPAPASGDFLVVQLTMDVPGGCSNPNYPCLTIGSDNIANQCLTLLTQSAPIKLTNASSS